MENRIRKIVFTLLFMPILMYAQQGNISGSWQGTLDIPGMKLSLIFNLDGEPTMDSPDQGAYGIPLTIEEVTATSVRLSVPAINAKYEGELREGRLVGKFIQHGMPFQLTLSPHRKTPKNRPQTPTDRIGYTEQEVTFINGDARLSGTLTLPKDYSRNTPVLVMVTGSGLQNRDEELFEHRPFAVIADHLAKAGIGTLRYDDRGFGKSTGDIVNCTTDDLKADAMAGVELLRKDFSHVGVLGHSEGGTIAMMLAGEKKVDFIVSLAGMTISGKELLLAQNRDLLMASGIDAELANNYCMVLSDIFDLMTAGKVSGSPTTVVEEVMSSRNITVAPALKDNLQKVVEGNTPYLRRFLIVDVSKTIQGIECPVMALNGTLDTQVNASQNIDPIKSKLTNPRSTTKVYPGLNHLFQHAKTGRSDEYGKIEETISPEVLEDITRWILEVNDSMF